MSVAARTDAIRRMLDDGHLTHADEDGHVQELYGTCPNDGISAPVYRISRAGRRITDVVVRCPTCGHDALAALEGMHLR